MCDRLLPDVSSRSSVAAHPSSPSPAGWRVGPSCPGSSQRSRAAEAGADWPLRHTPYPPGPGQGASAAARPRRDASPGPGRAPRRTAGCDLVPGALVLVTAERPIQARPRPIPFGHVSPRAPRPDPVPDPVDLPTQVPPRTTAPCDRQQRLEYRPRLVRQIMPPNCVAHRLAACRSRRSQATSEPDPAAGGRLRSDGRVGHDLPDLLRAAARGSDLGSPLQCVLT